MQSLNSPAAALWEFESSWSSGPSERKHVQNANAVDAVMAMLPNTPN
jgi:hypothetical protein